MGTSGRRGRSRAAASRTAAVPLLTIRLDGWTDDDIGRRYIDFVNANFYRQELAGLQFPDAKAAGTGRAGAR